MCVVIRLKIFQQLKELWSKYQVNELILANNACCSSKIKWKCYLHFPSPCLLVFRMLNIPFAAVIKSLASVWQWALHCLPAWGTICILYRFKNSDWSNFTFTSFGFLIIFFSKSLLFRFNLYVILPYYQEKVIKHNINSGTCCTVVALLPPDLIFPHRNMKKN